MGVQQRTLLRRVLRRVLESAFEKVLRRVLRRCLAVGFNVKKGLSRRHLEGRSTPFREYDPLGVCPSQSLGTFQRTRKTAAGKLAAPSGTLLDFLLRDRHSLLELF